MHAQYLIGSLPIWALFLATLFICVGSIECGAAIARFLVRRQADREPDGPLGAMVGAIMGLLALLLAFTFGLAADRFEARKQLVLEEANAIGTTWLRAGLLPEARQAEIRRLLTEYAEARVSIRPNTIDAVLRQADQTHQKLWAETQLLAQQDMDPQLRSLFIISLNQLIDLHQSRRTIGIQYHIPDGVWLVTYLLAAISMLVIGYHVAIEGARTLRSTPVIAVAFSIVIAMIADLDRPGEGVMRVSQQPIEDTLQMMNPDPR